MDKDTLYIDLKEVLIDHKHELSVKPKIIRKVLDDLHIDEEYEVVISGNYGEWGNLINLIISKINNKDIIN